MLISGAQFPHAFILEFWGHFCTCSFIDYQGQSCALINSNNACGNCALINSNNACGNCTPLPRINAYASYFIRHCLTWLNKYLRCCILD